MGKIMSPYFQTKFIESIDIDTASKSYYLKNGIPRDFPLAGLILNWRGRITAAGAPGVGAPLTEAPWTMIKRVIVSGVHRVRGTEVILDMYGPLLRAYNRIYQGIDEKNYQSATLDIAAAPYDLDFTLYIPFMMERVVPQQKISTTLDAQQYNSLTLEIQHGDFLADLYTAAYGAGGGTATPHAFGVAAAGNPVINVHRVCTMLGADVNFKPALIKRTFKEEDVSSKTFTNSIITDLWVGNAIRSAMFSFGVTQTAPAKTPIVWGSTTPVIGQLSLTQNDVPIRQGYFDDLQMQNCRQFGIKPSDWPQGYGVFEFVEHGDYNQSLLTYDFALRGKRLQLKGDLTTAATTKMTLVETEIIPYKG